MTVQRCTLPLPIPLLPLWAVRPVQSLSACTTVHFTFTYTSTPPMGRTACTEPQCLYNGALYLYLDLYSPYGPYGLYRASVPVQRCTLPFLLSPPRHHIRTFQKLKFNIRFKAVLFQWLYHYTIIPLPVRFRAVPITLAILF